MVKYSYPKSFSISLELDIHVLQSIKRETEKSSVATDQNRATSNFFRQFRSVYRFLVITDAIDSTVGCGVP